MANAESDVVVLTVRLPGTLVKRLDTLVSERRDRARPAPLSRNTVLAQIVERAVSSAERDR